MSNLLGPAEFISVPLQTHMTPECNKLNRQNPTCKVASKVKPSLIDPPVLSLYSHPSNRLCENR